MMVRGGLINGWEKKRNKRQRRKGKINPAECSYKEYQGEIRKPFISEAM